METITHQSTAASQPLGRRLKQALGGAVESGGKAAPPPSQHVHIEREIAGLQARLSKVSDDLAAAAIAAEGAARKHREFLTDGGTDDPSDGAALSNARRSAADNEAALREAMEDLTTRLADARQRLSTEQDRIDRENVADELERRADLIEREGQQLTDRLQAVADAHGALVEVIRAGGLAEGLSGFPFAAEIYAASIFYSGIEGAMPGMTARFRQVGIVTGEVAVDAARRLQFGRLRALALQVRRGDAPATLPITPREAALPPPVKVDETAIVLSEPIAYRNLDSEVVRVIAGGVRVPVPVAMAAAELGIGHAHDSQEGQRILAAYRSTAAPVGYGYKNGWRDVGVNLATWAEAERVRLATAERVRRESEAA